MAHRDAGLERGLQLLRDLGRIEEARTEDEAALKLTQNPAERELLRQRLVDQTLI